MKLVPIFMVNKENDIPIGSIAMEDDVAQWIEDHHPTLELLPSFLRDGDSYKMVSCSIALGNPAGPKN